MRGTKTHGHSNQFSRKTFDLKRNEIQVKINRLKNKVTAHEKADNSFDETLLGLLDIATQAGNIFERSQNLDLKRVLLKFVFESLTLTEGVLSYKLKFPFNEFVNSNILIAQAAKAYEPKQTLINQGLTENDNENVQFGSLKSYEPQIIDKKQEVTLKNATSLQIGELDSNELARNSVININFFLNHRSEVLAMKEQVQMIKGYLTA